MPESLRLVEGSKSVDPVVMTTRLLHIKGMILREMRKKLLFFFRRMSLYFQLYFYPSKTGVMKDNRSETKQEFGAQI